MRSLFFSLLFIPLFAIAQDSEFVIVKNGEIHPEGAVATVEDIAQAAVQAVAVAQSAAIVSNAAHEVEGMITAVSEVINSVEGVGYIRGYMLDFGVTVADINTNATATIIRQDHNVSEDATNTYSDIYVYFSEEPATLPVIQWTAALREDATWVAKESLDVQLTNITVDSVSWECYKIRIAFPIAMKSAFMRAYAEAQQSTVGVNLPVENGIKVGSYEPLTAEIMCGTNTFKYVGGIRVQ